jgi:hypothetical protein
MDTGDPTATDSSLTYDEEADQWRARDETRGVTVQANTREPALDALDEAVADDGETDLAVGVDAADPFVTAPTLSSGRSAVSRNVDEAHSYSGPIELVWYSARAGAPDAHQGRSWSRFQYQRTHERTSSPTTTAVT